HAPLTGSRVGPRAHSRVDARAPRATTVARGAPLCTRPRPSHRRGVPDVTESPPTPPPLLEVRGLYKTFGPMQVLRDVHLAIPPGQVTALVGDNGAGKSTLVKCISG